MTGKQSLSTTHSPPMINLKNFLEAGLDNVNTDDITKDVTGTLEFRLFLIFEP